MNRLILFFFVASACGSDTECPQTEAVSIETAASSGDETPTRHLSSSRPRPIGAPAALDGIERFRVPIGYAPTKGSEEAAITIVTFSDFECPFCRRVQETLARVEEEYGAQVRWVFRQNPLPFHQHAMPAAIASMEVYAQGGPELFYRLHDALFAEPRLDRETILRVSAAVGADPAEVERAIDDERYKTAIEADQELARRIGARGTPNFFINGRQLSGAQPFERFRTMIDEELRTVAQLRQRGVAADQIYATLTWRGNAGATQGTTPTPTPARRQPDPNAIYNLPLDPNLPSKGPANALVTIAMVSDFQCPFCSRALPTIDQVVQHYGNDVRVVWLNNPLAFHQNAMPAAELALEAHRQQGDAGFWAMHDLLFQNQRALDRQSLEGYARQRGLNMRQVTRALDSHTHRATIEAQQRTVTGLGATGTPSFFINGRNLRGAQPFPRFQTVIDEELARARQLIQNGTPRRTIYQEATRNGATSPQFVNAQPAAPTQPQQPTHYAIAVPRNAPRRGASNRRAQVVIQQFGDFECPFCERVRPTVERILREYPTVQIVWRDYPLPFHRHAQLAHEAAREVHRQAGDRGFWQYHELLYDNRTALEEADLINYARQIRGVNIGRFRRALNGHRHQQAVEDDMEAVRDAGARIGTPSFFINGRLLQGAQPFEAFKAAIDEELAANP